MLRVVTKIFVLLIVVLGLFVLLGKKITDLTANDEGTFSELLEVSPEGGKGIFWGKGRCFTCHSLGGKGSAVRGPNLGIYGDRFISPIGERATMRAVKRSEETGRPYSAMDYLVESLVDPGAYIVKGYKNEMAVVHAPPISLGLDEVKALTVYLQSLGGDIDMEALNTPDEITGKYFKRILASSAAGGGDSDKGAVVFTEMCSDCHMIRGEGGGIGPDLSRVGLKGLKFISESILRPSASFMLGYETVVVTEIKGRRHVGIKSLENSNWIEITKGNGEVAVIQKNEIKDISIDEYSSIMPDDILEMLTVRDYQNLLAFLSIQKGER